MIHTKSLITSIKDVPETWIYEHYLSLPESLSGQDMMILSPFNPKDKRPSFSLYTHRTSGKYCFKDFSTGIGGNTIELVKQLYMQSNAVELTSMEVMLKVEGDYNQYILDHGDYGIAEFKKYTKYKVTTSVKRKWNTNDKKYWQQYEIGSKELESDGVYPLERYEMDNEEKCLIIQGEYLYGYHRLDGTLYKVYQPKVTDKKFIKVKDYIQGMDQLTFSSPNLIITASLKDRRCLLNLGFDLESIAPDSENAMIKPDTMAALKYKYKNIMVMLDSDEAGIKAMKKYKERDELEGIVLPMEKDIARSVKIHGSESVYQALEPYLKTKLISKEMVI